MLLLLSKCRTIRKVTVIVVSLLVAIDNNRFEFEKFYTNAAHAKPLKFRTQDFVYSRRGIHNYTSHVYKAINLFATRTIISKTVKHKHR